MSDSKPVTRWNIIRQARNGLCYLDHLNSQYEDTGEAIFTKIQQLCSPSPRHFCQNKPFLLYDPVVYVVTAANANNSTDPEAQTCEVFIRSKRYSEAYTLAIRDPKRLEKTSIGGAQLDNKQKAGQIFHGLLVVHEVRRAKVVLLFGALSLMSFVIGLVAGLTSGKAELGIAVTAGLFQSLTMLQWSYIWVIRR